MVNKYESGQIAVYAPHGNLIELWKLPFLIGKTSKNGPFPIAVLNHQRVDDFPKDAQVGMLWRVQSHRAWSAQCGSHAGREIPWRFLSSELWEKPWKIQHPNFNQSPCLWGQFWTKQLVLQNFGTSGNGPFPTWLLPGRASGQPINKECQHQHAEPFAADLSTVLTPNQSDWTWNAVALQWHWDVLAGGVHLFREAASRSLDSVNSEPLGLTAWVCPLGAWDSIWQHTSICQLSENLIIRYVPWYHGEIWIISLSIYISIFTRIFTVACPIYVGYA